MAKTSGGNRGGKVNREAVAKAEDILRRFDFQWRMDDRNFKGNYEYAKRQMQQFARYAAQAGNARETKRLRDAWTRKYNEANAARMRR